MGSMKNTSKTRCTLSADVYSYGDGQYVKTLKASGFFEDATTTLEASDVLEEALHSKFEQMMRDDPGAYDPDLQDTRLSWD